MVPNMAALWPIDDIDEKGFAALKIPVFASIKPMNEI